MIETRLSATLLDRLREGRPLVALTGAGISAESGLATFRGPGGIWEGRDPVALATPEAFRREPETVWRFYHWRRQQAARARPNRAHEALAALERRGSEFTLVTQNVDGLHERAGSRAIVRLHGSLWRLRCSEEGTEFDDIREDLGDLPPRCRCGALLRPGVVWFGEALPEESLARAEASVLTASVVLVIGTSSLVYPAAALPSAAQAAGAWIVEINPEETPLSRFADERLVGRAGDLVPQLVQQAGLAAL